MNVTGEPRVSNPVTGTAGNANSDEPDAKRQRTEGSPQQQVDAARPRSPSAKDLHRGKQDAAAAQQADQEQQQQQQQSSSSASSSSASSSSSSSSSSEQSEKQSEAKSSKDKSEMRDRARRSGGSGGAAASAPQQLHEFHQDEPVEVFFRFSHEKGMGYFPVDTEVQGQLHPCIAKTDGWMPALIEHDWEVSKYDPAKRDSFIKIKFTKIFMF